MRALVASLLVLAGCGSHLRIPDAGSEDSGLDSGTPDAGRLKGDDPPPGWSLALKTPADAGTVARWGVSAAMALDQFGQPMIAALVVDPNSDGVFDDNRLVFTRWNGVTKTYQDPVTIEVVGDVVIDHPNRQVSIARDALTGQIAVAYVAKADTAIRRAWSDDEGAHWSQEDAVSSTNLTFSNPVLAISGGTTHLAYERQCVGLTCSEVWYGVRGDGGTYVGDPVSATGGVAWPISLAVSSTGTPSLAFFYRSGSDGGTVTLQYEQSLSHGATIDSTTAPMDKVPSVSLSLVNDVPHVAYHLPSATNPDAEVWFARATDTTGLNWSAPLALPRNGPAGLLDGTQWYQAIAGDSVVANFQERAFSPQQCGGPKLWLDATNGSMPCHPPEVGGALVHTFDFAGWWITMASHQAGKLTIAMDYEPRTNPLIDAGVAVYRQP